MPKRKTVPSVGEKIFKDSPEEKLLDAAIGNFIQTFSMCEGNLLLVAIEQAKLDPILGKAIFSPLRVDDGITRIRRLMEAKKKRSKSARELENMLDQLAVINKLRNDLVHLGLWAGHRHGTTHRVITNKWAAHARRLIRYRPVSVKIIEDATRDLDDIWLLIVWHSSDARWHKGDYAMRALRKAYPIGTPLPWRYKYPEPKSSHRKRRAKPQARATPPRS